MLQKCKKMQNLTFFENPHFYIFYHISSHIWPTESYFTSNKALDILFWPYFIIFSPNVNICWAIMSRNCQRFFDSPFKFEKIDSRSLRKNTMVLLKYNNQTDKLIKILSITKYITKIWCKTSSWQRRFLIPRISSRLIFCRRLSRRFSSWLNSVLVAKNCNKR